jgi:hypothetical protein
MVTLLIFVVRYCAKLFDRPGFRFRDSAVGWNNAEGSYLLLESVDVQVYISNERDQITWEMRSLYDSDKRNWFSFDLIARLLGSEIATGVMDPANSELLSRNLGEIIVRFGKDNVTATLDRLNELKAERAKRL